MGMCVREDYVAHLELGVILLISLIIVMDMEWGEDLLNLEFNYPRTYKEHLDPFIAYTNQESAIGSG